VLCCFQFSSNQSLRKHIPIKPQWLLFGPWVQYTAPHLDFYHYLLLIFCFLAHSAGIFHLSRTLGLSCYVCFISAWFLWLCTTLIIPSWHGFLGNSPLTKCPIKYLHHSCVIALFTGLASIHFVNGWEITKQCSFPQVVIQRVPMELLCTLARKPPTHCSWICFEILEHSESVLLTSCAPVALHQPPSRSTHSI